LPSLPQPIIELIAALNKLPGVGPRSAERLAIHIVQSETNLVRQLATVLVQARERIRSCEVCGALTEQSPCTICSDPRRDASIVCVVERPVDIISIERAGNYRGKFHVLGGRISPINGVEPEDLRIGELEQRLTQEPIREIILALGADVEGDATGFYLAKRWASHKIKVTRIAHGVPAGTGLEFADELTLSRALEGRRELQ